MQLKQIFPIGDTRRFQWHRFKILLNKLQDEYAEIQILCRLEDDKGYQQPVNRFGAHIVEDILEKEIPFPFTGDVYVLGRAVLDDGLYAMSQEIKFVAEDYASDFEELSRKLVILLTWRDMYTRFNVLHSLQGFNNSEHVIELDSSEMSSKKSPKELEEQLLNTRWGITDLND